MLLLFFLFLAANSSNEILDPNRIEEICLEAPEKLLDFDYMIKNKYYIDKSLIKVAIGVIGVTELRNVLSFTAPLPWRLNSTIPSPEAVKSAASVQEYYLLKEPRNPAHITFVESFSVQRRYPGAVIAINKRYPLVRTIFRKSFEKILAIYGRIDREIVDFMISEFLEIYEKVSREFLIMRPLTEYYPTYDSTINNSLSVNSTIY
uniref:Secreted protein n=1 Tax=Caenorhabditis tropicalis TaxID=1561998 RepID=A0A1I7UZQ3_9PELO